MRARTSSDERTTVHIAGDQRPSSRLSLLIRGDGVHTSHPLPPTGELLIGRASNADIRIDLPSISRRHAILRIGSVMSLEDLGSRNGTRVCNEPVESRTIE